MKRVAWTTALVVATAMVLVVLWQFRVVVVLFLLSLTLAAIVRPWVERLVERRVPRSAAIGLTFATGALGALAILYVCISLLVPDLEWVLRDMGASYDYIHRHWPEGNALQQAIARRLPPLEKVPASLTDLSFSGVLQQLLGVSRNVFDLSVDVLVVLVLSLYWSFDYHRFERLWMSLLPVEERVRARELWRRIEHDVGIYMQSEVLQSLAAGLTLGVILSISGFPYPITVSILAALAWLVPWIGPALAIAAVWFAALLDFADTTVPVMLTRGTLASVLVIVVFLTLEFVVEPRLVNRRDYSSLLIALVALAMVELVGIVGLLLGPPVAIAIQCALDQYVWQSVYEVEGTPGTDVAALKARLAELRLRIDPEHAAPVANILGRVSQLLEDSQAVLPQSSPEPAASPIKRDSDKAESATVEASAPKS